MTSNYRALFTNAAGSAPSNAAILSIATLRVVTTQPVDTTVGAGNNASFASAATGSPSPSIQWEVSTDSGATWNPVPGATNATLTFVATAADHLSKYRAVLTNLAGSVTSNAATLSVATLSTASSQPNNNSLTAGGTATFTSTVTSTVAPTIHGRSNGWRDIKRRIGCNDDDSLVCDDARR